MTLSHAEEYKVTGELGANKLKSYLDIVVLGDGRSITEIAVSSIGSAPPLEFEQILATTRSRISAAARTEIWGHCYSVSE